MLRMGRFQGLRGPGMFYVIPIVDSVSRVVDQRVRVTDVTAESALTKDTVPVNVDAIVFWVVWDAEKCVLEVENFFDAISLGAQTALREAIGAPRAARDDHGARTLGKELQRILDEKTNPVGDHRAVGRDPAGAYSAGAGRRDVAEGAGRARAAGAHHPRHGGDRDRRRSSPTRARCIRTIRWRSICAR